MRNFWQYKTAIAVNLLLLLLLALAWPTSMHPHWYFGLLHKQAIVYYWLLLAIIH